MTISNSLEVKNLVKTYQAQRAVDDVSFQVQKGKIFGLLGPNGAGKTTLIRMITGILQPDSGSVSIMGQVSNLESNAKFIGYMPEERGLYKKMKAEEQAIYLAQLKGLSYSEAKTKVQFWFDKLEMGAWKNKKIEEVSKGMAQKLQFVCTVLHDPSIIILDEPFSGLDPLNADIIKKEIYELAKQGATIIFSTHRMEQVEEICEHIVLINNGKIILDSTVLEAKNRFKSNQFIIETTESFETFKEERTLFEIIEQTNQQLKVRLSDTASSSDLLRFALQQNVSISTFREDMPSLNSIFIELVKNNKPA
jgi:ABC-2 type transport system ATP-binding protein